MKIARGEATFDDVVSHSLNVCRMILASNFDDLFFLQVFSEKFSYFVNNIHKMDELFEMSFSKIIDTQGADTHNGVSYLRTIDYFLQESFSPSVGNASTT